MMPTVARLMAEKRRTLGAAHVAECWKRGVTLGQPGWFFAREGPLAVGTPFEDDTLRDFGASRMTGTQGLLMLAQPGSENPIRTGRDTQGGASA